MDNYHTNIEFYGIPLRIEIILQSLFDYKVS